MVIILASVVALQAQDPVTLQFTGQNQNGQYVPLTTVLVENTTKHWQEILYYPDTTLFIGHTGIEEIEQIGDGVRLFQNVPNPFDGVTDFALQLPEASDVQLEIYDLNGKVTATYQGTLEPGCHQFKAWLATPQTYLLHAQTDDGSVQIKMVNTGKAGQNRITYIGKGNTLTVKNLKNDPKGSTNMPFNYGDIMSYIGYAHLANTEFTSETVMKAQYNSELLPLIFTLPLPTVTTEAATNILSTEAWLNGSVIENAEYPVTERGFLLADNEQLTESVQHLADAGGENFHCAVHNLQIATRYYFRAYVRTALGITYGDVLFFDTQAETPVVLTIPVTDITYTTATCGGSVTATGGSDVTSRGVCWSTSQNPTINNDHTPVGNGMGTFSYMLSYLSPNTTYYVRAYATNNLGTAYGSEVTFTTAEIFHNAGDAQPCPGTPTVTDHEGNVYNTVQIGTQCWTKENIRTTTSPSTGTYIIPTAGTDGTYTGKQAVWYNNDSATYAPLNYGLLYNWNAAVDTFNTTYGETSVNTIPSNAVSVNFMGHRRGICPAGWHLPNNAEWIMLTGYVIHQSEYTCEDITGLTNIAKALASTEGWSNSEYYSGCGCFPCCVGYAPYTNNSLGFGAVPAGNSYGSLSISGAGEYAFFWSSNDYGISSVLHNMQGDVTLVSHYKYDGNSVRCLRDFDMTLAVITGVVSDITATSAMCCGNVISDGGDTVTARGICWSTSQNPTIYDNHTTDGTGTGVFSSFLTGLATNTTYYARAYATNSGETTYGSEVTFTTICPGDAQPCPSTPTVTDYEGNVYNTVQIGNQCWMRENLRTTHSPDGTTITNGFSPNNTTPYYYDFNSHPLPLETRGYCYNWPAAMIACPTGWHLPSKAEWTALTTYMSNHSYYTCGVDTNNIAKALASIEGWISYDYYDVCAPGNQTAHTNNVSGFSAVPAGTIVNGGYANNVGSITFFWSSTESTGNYAWYHALFSEGLILSANLDVRYNGYSVRCLRD